MGIRNTKLGQTAALAAGQAGFCFGRGRLGCLGLVDAWRLIEPALANSEDELCTLFWVFGRVYWYMRAVSTS